MPFYNRPDYIQLLFHMKTPDSEKYKPQVMKSKLTPERIKVINKIRRETIKRANQAILKDIQRQNQIKKNKFSLKTSNQPSNHLQNNSKQQSTTKKSTPHKHPSSSHQQQQNSTHHNINQSHLSKGLRSQSITTQKSQKSQNYQKNHKHDIIVTFDQTKNQVIVCQTMYNFMGESNSLIPFGDPDYDEPDDEGSERRTRRRNKKNMSELQLINYSDEQDDEYFEQEKPKKLKNNKKKRFVAKKKIQQKKQTQEELKGQQQQTNQVNLVSEDESNQQKSLQESKQDYSISSINKSLIKIDKNEQQSSKEETPSIEIDKQIQAFQSSIQTRSSKRKGNIPNLNYDPNANNNRIKRIEMPAKNFKEVKQVRLTKEDLGLQMNKTQSNEHLSNDKNENNEQKPNHKTQSNEEGSNLKKDLLSEYQRQTPDKFVYTNGIMTRSREKSLLQLSKQK